jgi:hypothetical protein
MPVNEKILFGSFQYLFSLKTIIYAFLSSAMLGKNHAVLRGKNINFQGGGNKYPFLTKDRPLPVGKVVPYSFTYITDVYNEF